MLNLLFAEEIAAMPIEDAMGAVAVLTELDVLIFVGLLLAILKYAIEH